MAIQANEIRIGNWLNRVSSTRNDVLGNIQFNEMDWYGIGEGIDCLENYEPITLTEEWLAKFGFKQDYNMRILFHNKKMSFILGDYPINTNKEYGKLFFWENRDIENRELLPKIYCVHQLQNLYFALTNTELEIK